MENGLQSPAHGRDESCLSLTTTKQGLPRDCPGAPECSGCFIMFCKTATRKPQRLSSKGARKNLKMPSSDEDSCASRLRFCVSRGDKGAAIA